MTTDQLVDSRKFYIVRRAGVDPSTPNDVSAVDPSTEQPCALISFGSQADTDAAVVAAVGEQADPSTAPQTVHERQAPSRGQACPAPLNQMHR